MPVKRTESRKKIEILTNEMFLELVLGPNIGEDPWENDQQRRQCWEDFREEILAELVPGARPHAMLIFELGYKPSKKLAMQSVEKAA